MAKRKYTKGKDGKIYEYDYLIINGVDPKVAKDLKNISVNLGHVSLSGLLKPELRRIRDGYPFDMREDPDAE